MVRGWGDPEGPPRRLILLRHGEVDERDRTILYGSMDVALSARGVEQGGLAAQAVAAMKPRAILCSDLSRASTLASRIGELTGAVPTVSPAFRERNFGVWQGRPMSELIEGDPEAYRAYMKRRWEAKPSPDAENFDDVGARVLPPLHAALADGGPIVLVSHSGPMRAILREALLLPGEALFRMRLDYCSITIIDYFGGGLAVVERLNDKQHLS